MFRTLEHLPPELQLEALRIIVRTDGLSAIKGICESNQYFKELCQLNKNILIGESDKPRLEKLFKYIEKNGAKNIQNQETGSFCERNKDIINTKIDEYITKHGQERANVFEINVQLNETEFDQDVDFIISDSLQNAFEEWPYRHFMRRGDILFNSVYLRYRNDGKCLFDGEKLVGLEGDFNEYGHVSHEFLSLVEFPPDYWEDLAYDGVRVAWTDFSKLNFTRIYEDHHYDRLLVCYEVDFKGHTYGLMLEPGEEVPVGNVLIYNDTDEHANYDYFVETSIIKN